MQEFYEYVYRIDITYKPNDGFELNLIRVVKLFETRKNGYSWPDDNNILKVVTIEPENWGKIVLINHRNDSKLNEIMRAGAHLSAKSEVYEDEFDARIQMAYIASKHGIKKSKIEETTNGFVSVKAYTELVDIFHEEFPEKFI